MRTPDIVLSGGYTDERAVHPMYVKFAPMWTICRDFGAGEMAVKGKTLEYLPPLTSEHVGASYEDYILRAKFLPMFRRTVETLVGAAVRYPADVSGPMDVTSVMDDITLSGETLDGFVASLLREVLTVGRAAIFVDVSMDGRPFWRLIPGDEMTTWLEKDGACRVVQRRRVERTSGEWGVECYTQWRAWRKDGPAEPCMLSVLRENKTGGLVADENAARSESTFTDVRGEPVWPLVPTTAYCAGTFAPDVPPLLGLALLNRNHYMKSADQARGLHWVGFATPWFTLDKDDLVGSVEIGPNQIIQLPRDSDVGMLESSGAGLSHIADELKELKQEGESLGARILAPSVYGTATAERISAAAETASLGSIVDIAEQAVQRALDTHMRYLGAPAGSAVVTLNRDFSSAAGEDTGDPFGAGTEVGEE